MGRLTDLKIRSAKPRDRVYKLYDGDGLFLRVPPSGEKSWQLRYYREKLIDGKMQRVESLVTIGKLKRYSLKEAREEANEFLKLAEKVVGKTLTEHLAAERKKQAVGQSNTFGVVAEAWVKQRAKNLHWSPRHEFRVRRSLGLDEEPGRKIKRESKRKDKSWDVVRRGLNAHPIVAPSFFWTTLE